jgi:hypothetical protein
MTIFENPAMNRFLKCIAIFIGLNISFTAFANAQAIVVGADSNCQFTDLQAAIEFASGNNNEIHVENSYRGPPVTISNKILRIYGGYNSCTDPSQQPFTSYANVPQLDGSLNAGANLPVISIHSSSGKKASLDLRNFVLIFGHDKTGSGYGGGIQYVSNGISGSLVLSGVQILLNNADYGGGIYYDGEASGADGDVLTLADWTQIIANYAAAGGGGIRLNGHVRMEANSPHIQISGNKAEPTNVNDGRGGGLQMLDESIANIGATGDGAGIIYGNTARYGGGIAIHDDAEANLYTNDVRSRVRINGNTATFAGGGIFLAPTADTLAGHFTTSRLCGWGYAIDGNNAQNGAAIYGDADVQPDYTGVSQIYLTSTNNLCKIPESRANCGVQTSCNSISGNTATQAGGAIIELQNQGDSQFDKVSFRGNTASRLFQGQRSSGGIVASSLIAENTLADDIFNGNSANAWTFYYDTIVNNPISGATLFTGTLSKLELSRSVIWQPDKTSLASSVDTSIDYSLMQDGDSLDPTMHSLTLNNVVQADPDFVNAAGGNYQLGWLSPAIDFAPAETTNDATDLEREIRGKALVRFDTAYDIGAFERQRIPDSTFPLDETFEETDIVSMDLPGGWTNTVLAGGVPGFVVTNSDADNSGFAVHADDPGGSSESILTTPSFLALPRQQLSFRHAYEFEPRYDGAVLEIKIGNGTFQDILDAGGKFLKGGYTDVLWLGNPPNPIMPVGRPIWTGDDSTLTYSDVLVQLPASSANQSVQLRWIVGSDGSGTHRGYWLDNIHLQQTDGIFSDGFDGSAKQ